MDYIIPKEKVQEFVTMATEEKGLTAGEAWQALHEVLQETGKELSQKETLIVGILLGIELGLNAPHYYKRMAEIRKNKQA